MKILSGSLWRGLLSIDTPDGAVAVDEYFADAIAEGMSDRGEADCWTCPIEAYAELWEDINGKGSWNKDPWVWPLTF